MTVETTFGLRNTMDSQLSDDGQPGSYQLAGWVSTEKRAWSYAFSCAHLVLDLWRYADFAGLIPPWKPDSLPTNCPTTKSFPCDHTGITARPVARQ